MSGRSSQWQVTRQRAFRRDREAGAICWLCKQKIDYTLAMSSCDDAYESDHILPYSHHPELENDLANIAASHRKCNRSRKNKAGLNELGNTSREW